MLLGSEPARLNLRIGAARADRGELGSDRSRRSPFQQRLLAESRCFARGLARSNDSETARVQAKRRVVVLSSYNRRVVLCNGLPRTRSRSRRRRSPSAPDSGQSSAPLPAWSRSRRRGRPPARATRSPLRPPPRRCRATRGRAGSRTSPAPRLGEGLRAGPREALVVDGARFAQARDRLRPGRGRDLRTIQARVELCGREVAAPRARGRPRSIASCRFELARAPGGRAPGRARRRRRARPRARPRRAASATAHRRARPRRALVRQRPAR